MRDSAQDVRKKRRGVEWQPGDTPALSPLPEETKRRLLSPQTLYDPSFAQAVIEDSSDGYSLGGFAGRIGVARRTIDNWAASHPEFALAVSRAKAARQRWWESILIHVAQTGGTGSQGQIAIFGVINTGAGDWKQKQEIEHTGQLTLAALVESSMKTIEGQTIEAQAKIAEPDQSPSDAPSEKENDLFG